jgi:hypothetical protein
MSSILSTLLRIMSAAMLICESDAREYSTAPFSHTLIDNTGAATISEFTY